MKNKFDILIAIASWEQRFALGTKKNITNAEISEFYCYSNINSPHPKETKENIQQLISEEQLAKNMKHSEFNFDSTIDIWKSLSESITRDRFYRKKVLLDVTTCPREIIWYILFFLRKNECHISFVYYKPGEYPGEWLTKDTRRPRFIIKHSGISEFNRPTGLFILTGFDPNRTQQLINFYEPKFILLGVQETNDLDKNSKNEALHQELIKNYKNHIEVFSLNCYDEDKSLPLILEKIEKHLSEYNFIMTSLGPKISAITIYKVFLKHPEIALSYARSHEYNINYSQGIGSSCEGGLTY
jgi:hypothetical protein